MTLSVRFRRMTNAVLELVDTMVPPPEPKPSTWTQLRAFPAPTTARELSARALDQADDAFARLDAMRARFDAHRR